MAVDIEFTDNSVAVKNAMSAASIAFLYEAAAEVEAESKRNSRVDSGQLKGSWTYSVDESSMKAQVGSSLENAIWEEFGTGEYALGGDGRKGGWKYKDGMGHWHYTRGKSPNRTLYRAFDAKKAKIKARAASIIKKGMK